jgi:sigma-B regulation protein RsbU (phosphoserine phosphatase)
MYGEDRVEEFMIGLAPAEAEPLKRLAGLVRTFESGRPAFDDMAAILLSFEAMSPP